MSQRASPRDSGRFDMTRIIPPLRDERNKQIMAAEDSEMLLNLIKERYVKSNTKESIQES